MSISKRLFPLSHFPNDLQLDVLLAQTQPPGKEHDLVKQAGLVILVQQLSTCQIFLMYLCHFCKFLCINRPL